ncbi:MAG: endonuclease III [Clostridia bacterium]|nr:endonuclease III [Clostridia bacterium]
MKKENQKIALAELERLYPDARPALRYSTTYELLIAVILSAQCTDERVNIVTEKLFAGHNTPQTMLLLSQEQLEKYIFSCGLYRSKAAHILSASRDIVEKFGGEVPSTFEELTSLSGVGRKTANVVYSVAFGGDAIAVDTHVFRVSNRLGLAKGETPKQVEDGLHKSVPKEKWSKAHHWLIYHGRRVCRAQNPDCENCTLNAVCDYAKKPTKTQPKTGRKTKK